MEIVYRANDGKVFVNRKMCEEYENYITFKNSRVILRNEDGKILTNEDDYGEACSVEFPRNMHPYSVADIYEILKQQYGIELDSSKLIEAFNSKEKDAKNRYWFYDSDYNEWRSLGMFYDEIKEKREMLTKYNFPTLSKKGEIYEMPVL